MTDYAKRIKEKLDREYDEVIEREIKMIPVYKFFLGELTMEDIYNQLNDLRRKEVAKYLGINL